MARSRAHAAHSLWARLTLVYDDFTHWHARNNHGCVPLWEQNACKCQCCLSCNALRRRVASVDSDHSQTIITLRDY